MAEPISADPDRVPARRIAGKAPARPGHAPGWFGSIALLLEVALALRVLAADSVEWYVRRGGTGRLCVFDDTNIYWGLAQAIRAGEPYQVVEWSDIPHFALRTPGYPLVLAACQAIFGERTLAVRLVQAVLGTACVCLVYCLARELVDSGNRWMGRVSRVGQSGLRREQAGSESSLLVDASGEPERGWTIPLVAAWVAAVNPYYVLMSSLILSEAIFEPLMLTSLLGVAVLWRARSPQGVPAGETDRAGRGRHEGVITGWKPWVITLGTGAAAGAAVMVRPSWALFVPAMMAAWILASLGNAGSRGAAVRGALLCAVGAALVMGPWWYRNWHVYGRFVPTALWFGASLYDGLNPRASGASDMSFLGDPEIWPLGEEDQDAELTKRAIAFAREQPRTVLGLAALKFARFWSPWPNAGGFRGPLVGAASAIVVMPLYGLIVLGLWDRRRDARALVLLAGPLLYFCALHLVFASSTRYRIPAEMPALVLAGVGFSSVMNHWARFGRRATSLER
jgi:4-amino-4-deoxy-L-arabinose transferase-like glycosyltransferase